MMFQTILSAALLASCTTAQSNLPLSQPLQAILSHGQSGSLYTYPTDLTQGIIPKGIHSHNDYWRPLPFYSALSVGAISVEADIWLYNETLHIGHEVQALTEERTFDALYVQPILDILNKMNPEPVFPVEAVTTKNGVFDTDSGQTLYLYVDFKTDGEETFPYVVDALEPLRSAGYLTTWDGDNVVEGAVTVSCTGNAPLERFLGKEKRDVFYDARFPEIRSPKSQITYGVSVTSQDDFTAVFGEVRTQSFNDTQRELMKKQITAAHDLGLITRYWGLPAWPIGTRNAVWRMLWDAGVDLVNVDDVDGAADFWENLG